jgi:hypothetical protein
MLDSQLGELVRALPDRASPDDLDGLDEGVDRFAQ